MSMITHYENFLFEQYGSNKIVTKLSEYILKIININLGKLILNKHLLLNNELTNYEDISFINDKISIKISNRNYGNINTKSININNDIISDIDMKLEFILSSKEITAKKIFHNNYIFDTISHEISHIIELYLTEQQNSRKAKSWENGENLQKLQKKYTDKEWSDISYFIYLSLPHEMRARIESLNTDITKNNINGIKNTQKYIKSTKIYKDVLFLSKIDENILLKKLKLDNNYKHIIKDFSELFLENDNKNYENNFLKYIRNIKTKNEKLLNKLLKVSYNFENYTEWDYDFINTKINYDDYKK